MSERFGDWFQTATGLVFWPLDPRPEEVCIEDIAHHLSNECRYNGATRAFYSVAQHSVYVSRLVPPELALWGLLHDAAEAYCKDIPKPLKRWPAFAAVYGPIEARIMAAVCDHFGLPREQPPEVKLADVRVLLAEKRDLRGPSPRRWEEEGIEPMAELITPWEPQLARGAFHARFNQVWQAAAGASR